MASQPPPAPPVAVSEPSQIRIVSHCTLFYWWPVWAIGFVMALLTTIDGSRMALVPNKTDAFRHAKVTVHVEGKDITYPDNDVLVVPEGAHLSPSHRPDQPPDQPHLRIATVRSYGVLFTVVLLLVIVITNIPLRGLWSVVVIVLIVLLSVIFALAHYEEKSYWEYILNALGRLQIHLNAAGYLLISLALFVIWLVTFLLFDAQIYMVFTPGQLRVRQEIGIIDADRDRFELHTAFSGAGM